MSALCFLPSSPAVLHRTCLLLPCSPLRDNDALQFRRYRVKQAHSVRAVVSRDASPATWTSTKQEPVQQGRVLSRRVDIYDTTLRDGAQGEGISFTARDKINIAQRLDTFGVSYIEGGWPGSNPKDATFFAECPPLKAAKLVAFGSTRYKNTTCEKDKNVLALKAAETPVVTLVGKSWDMQVEIVLETTLEENLAMISDTVAYFKALGKEVMLDAGKLCQQWFLNFYFHLVLLVS